MGYSYSLTKHLVAHILLFSLLLQSCLHAPEVDPRILKQHNQKLCAHNGDLAIKTATTLALTAAPSSTALDEDLSASLENTPAQPMVVEKQTDTLALATSDNESNLVQNALTTLKKPVQDYEVSGEKFENQDLGSARSSKKADHANTKAVASRQTLQVAKTRLVGGMQPGLACGVRLEAHASQATPLHLAVVEAIHTKDATRLSDLVQQGVAINATDQEQATPLHWLVTTMARNQGARYGQAIGNLQTVQAMLYWLGNKLINHSPQATDIEVTILHHLLALGAAINAQDKYGYTPLHIAVETGHSYLAKLLLDLGADTSIRTHTGKCVLYMAVEQGNVSMLDLLTKGYASADSRYSQNSTLLHVAARQKDTAIMKKLLAFSIPVYACDEAGNTALHLAIQAGNWAHVALLLKAGADLYKVNQEGLDVIALASKVGGLPYVQRLCKLWPDLVHRLGNHGQSQVYLYQAIKEDNLPLVAHLIACGVDINTKDAFGRTALHTAIELGEITATKQLVNLGATYKLKDKAGFNALCLALRHYRVNQVLGEQLVSILGVALDKANSNGYYLLHQAAIEGDIKLVEALLDIGMDKDLEDDEGCTPLHWAAELGHKALVEFLLQKGADPNRSTIQRHTPLHWAARSGNLEIVSLLLDRGADTYATTLNGSIPLHWAADSGKLAVVRLFLDKGVNPNQATNLGYTALHFAAGTGDVAIVKLLLERGAEPNKRDNYGDTPLRWAVGKGHQAVIELLPHIDFDWKIWIYAFST
jgi:ankyrin repeat protein